MEINVGGFDRIARIAIGAVLVLLALTGTISAWGYLGLIPLATGLFKVCPAYSLLGIKTCPMNASDPKQ
ncbi:MAG: hypothetical protein RL357_1770 [Pseudomonadota bacterium]